MIELKTGNLLTAEVEALVNTVNSVGVMGKGLALQFKRAFPENFKDYKKACLAGQIKPGEVFVFKNKGIKPKYIINFATKNHWRSPSQLEYIEKGLVNLTGQVKKLGLSSIAVPPLGAGLGGLNWNEVKPLIMKSFEQLPKVQVLLFEPNVTPATSEKPVGTRRKIQ